MQLRRPGATGQGWNDDIGVAGDIPFFHFSVDDVFDSLIDVSDRDRALWSHPFFGFLRHAHDEFQANVDLYLFYRKTVNGRMRTLKDVSDAARSSFEENRWLRLGPHALDYGTPPHMQSSEEQVRTLDSIYAQIGRFAGRAATSKWVRLHQFSESFELAPYLRARGVEALFCTDRPATSYRMPPAVKHRLAAEGSAEHEGLTWIRTHLRIESLVRDGISERLVEATLEEILSRHRFVVLMTHEEDVTRAEVRAMTFSVMKTLKELGVRSA